MSGNAYQPGPLRRLHAFTDERRVGVRRPAGFAADTDTDPLALSRLEQLTEYHGRKADQPVEAPPPKRRRGRRPAGLSPAPAPGPNWVPIGPFAVRRGQAEGLPVVTGRVQDVAVASGGARVYAASANGGVWRSQDGGRTWQPTMDGTPTDIDPTGASAHTDTLSCGALALIEGANQATDRLYLGTGESFGASDDFRGTGMWSTTDGGTTWTREPARLGAPPPPAVDPLLGNGVWAIAVDPDDTEHAVAASTVGLYRRAVTGGAAGWQRESALPVGVAAGATMTSVVVARRTAGPLAGTNFYAIPFGQPPITSRTSAAPAVHGPWTALGAGFPTNQTGRCTLAVSTDDAPVLYALLAYDAPPSPPPANAKPKGALHGLYRLDLGDATPTWHKVDGVPEDVFGAGDHKQGWYDQAVAVDPENKNLVFVAGSCVNATVSSLYRCAVTPSGAGAGMTASADCTNIGARVHPDIHALTFRPTAPTELWVGCDGGVFTTSNARGGPDLFQARNTGLSTMTFNSLAGHPGTAAYAVGGVQDNGGVRYTGSEIWDHVLPGDGGASIMHQTEPTRYLNIYTSNTLRRAGTDGSRWSYDDVGPGLPNLRGADPKDEQILFYPPVVDCPGSPNTVAIGAERPHVSTTFGGGWDRLPFPTGLPGASGWPKVRSLAFGSPTRLYAGYTDGRLYRWDFAGGSWQAPLNLGAPTTGVNGALFGGLVSRAITCIVRDPADAANSVYLTVGGAGFADRVFRVTVGPPPANTVTWVSRPSQPGGGAPPVPAADRLLDCQHNVIVVDPNNPQQLYVGADIGVWRSTNGGQAWIPFSPGLPDAAVFDLRIVDTPAAGPTRLLRAATHGRGAWEIPLDGSPQPAVELLLRANELDRRRPNLPAPVDVALPGELGRTSRLDRSPDIRLDPPDPQGRHLVDPTQPIDQVLLEDRCTGDRIAVSVPATPVVTHVHLTVRSRGVFATDDVQATLLLGRLPADGDAAGAVPALPAGWDADVRGGTPIDTDTWKTVGTRTVNGLHAGQPAVATFELPSELLPPASESDGRRFALLAVLHHVDDPLPANATTVVADLVRTIRHTALRIATGAVLSSANPTGPPGGTGLLVPLTTALLARHRLDDAVTRLQAKLAAATAPPAGGGVATVRRTERYVLAMASAAKSHVDGGPAADIEAGRPGQGIGSYTLLGALGFELPGYTGLLGPGGKWTADVLRRGTPDPQLSLVKVSTTELPLRFARAALGAVPAGDTDTAPKIRAFTTGMLSAAAAGLVVGPQLADLLAVDTHLDWSRFSPSAGSAAVEDALRRRFLATVAGNPAVLSRWLPAAGAVPGPLWQALAATVRDAAGSGATRPKGWAAFEKEFTEGAALTDTRLRNAYGLLLSDLKTDSWPWYAWLGLLLPFMASVPVSLLVARELPHARNLFIKDASVDERAVHEAYTIGYGLGEIPTFVYSMILWGLVDDNTGPFVASLVMGLVRGALVGAALGTASNEGQDAVVRWLGFSALPAVTDVASMIAAIAAGSADPGSSFVFGLQTFPAMSGLTTLGVSALIKALTDATDADVGFWLPWALVAGGLAAGGIALAVALSHGGGYSSWFRREDPSLPILASTAAVAEPRPDPLARARVFSPDRLWTPPGTAAPTLADQRYPSGMRPLVRVWWEGNGDLEIKPGDNEVVFRQGAVETTVAVPAGTTVPQLVTALTGGLAGVKAVPEPQVPADPAVPLFAPGLADNGDRGLAVDHPVASARFVPVGKSKSDGVLIRHAPRADLSIPVGLRGAVLDPFPVVSGGLGDLDGSGLGHAADLAALLAMAAAPSLGTVRVVDALPALPDPAVTEVAQVFRRWNLDERRLAEWRQLVVGDGAPDPVPAGADDPMIRELAAAVRRPFPEGAPIAAAMGWVPLWRAWLTVAADPTADTDADTVHRSTPEVTMPDGVRKPKNSELTKGVRFLLDLGDPPGP